MSNDATLTLWFFDEKNKVLASVNAQSAPNVGELIELKGEWFLIVNRLWAVDDSKDPYPIQRARIRFRCHKYTVKGGPKL